MSANLTMDAEVQDSHLPSHTHTHTHLCTPSFPLTRQSKSDWRVKSRPPASPVRLRLQGHRQLDREDPTGLTVVMVLQSSSLSPYSTHTHTQTKRAPLQSHPTIYKHVDVNYDSLTPAATSWSTSGQSFFVVFFFIFECKCNLRSWNEYICQKTSNPLMCGAF